MQYLTARLNVIFERVFLSRFLSFLLALFLLLPVLPKSIAIYFLWALPCLAFLSFLFLGSHDLRCRLRSIDGLLFGFLLLFLAWILVVSSLHGILAVVVLPVLSIVVFLLLLVILADAKIFDRALFYCALLAALVALFSLGMQFFVLDKGVVYRSWRIMASGYGEWADFGNPIDAGLYFGFFSCVLLEKISRARVGFVASILSLMALLSLNAYLYFTFSRGPIVAVCAVIILLFVCRCNRKTSVLFLLLMICVVGSWFVFEPIWQAEIDRGATGRGPIWQQAWANVKSAILFGHGFPNAFLYWPVPGVSYDFEHNWFLSVWVRYGLLGWLLIVAVVLLAFYRCFCARASNVAVLSAVLLLFGVMAMQTYVDYLIRFPHFYWMLLWLPLGMICVSAHDQAGADT